MKHIQMTPTITPSSNTCAILIRHLLGLIFLTVLLACNQPENDVTVEQNDRPSPLLADTPQAPGMGFANFKNATLTIDPTLFELNEGPLFLKLSRGNGDILFLGRVQQHTPLSLKVDHLLDEEQLSYELFTEKTTVFGTIAL